MGLNVLTMTSHVNSICRSASLAFRNIGRVRKYLSQSSTERLVHAFITSKLDYCNSLMYGLPSTEVQKLQRVHNSAARLVVRAKRTEHISPFLRNLHWLPIRERISFKILLLTYKAINGLVPSYINSLITHYIPGRNLRSACQGLLATPKSNSATYGDRAQLPLPPQDSGTRCHLILGTPSLLVSLSLY